MDTQILSDRSVLVLDGPDTLALLERLVTSNTHDWEIGEARYGALLTPQGKAIADFIAHRTEAGALLDVATHAVGDLSKRLQMFRLRAKVDIGVDVVMPACFDHDVAGRGGFLLGAFFHRWIDVRQEDDYQGDETQQGQGDDITEDDVGIVLSLGGEGEVLAHAAASGSADSRMAAIRLITPVRSMV